MNNKRDKIYLKHSHLSVKTCILNLKCAVGGCNYSSSDKVDLHSWPKNPAVALQWDAFIKRTREDWVYDPATSSSKQYVCCVHFERDQYFNYAMWQNGFNNTLCLKDDAVPSSIHGLINPFLKRGINHLMVEKNVKGRIKCAVSGCRKTCADDVSLHRFPLSIEHHRLWCEFLASDKEYCTHSTASVPTGQLFICSDHFFPDDFQFISDRKLKPGVVPRILRLTPPTVKHKRIASPSKKQAPKCTSNQQDLDGSGLKKLSSPVEESNKCNMKKDSQIDYRVKKPPERVKTLKRRRENPSDLCMERLAQRAMPHCLPVPKINTSRLAVVIGHCYNKWKLYMEKEGKTTDEEFAEFLLSIYERHRSLCEKVNGAPASVNEDYPLDIVHDIRPQSEEIIMKEEESLTPPQHESNYQSCTWSQRMLKEELSDIKEHENGHAESNSETGSATMVETAPISTMEEPHLSPDLDASATSRIQHLTTSESSETEVRPEAVTASQTGTVVHTNWMLDSNENDFAVNQVQILDSQVTWETEPEHVNIEDLATSTTSDRICAIESVQSLSSECPQNRKSKIDVYTSVMDRERNISKSLCFTQSENDFKAWLLVQRDLQDFVSVDELYKHALNFILTSSSLETSKSLRKWASSFLDDFHSFLHTKTSVQQSLPGDLEDKRRSFLDSIKNIRDEYHFDMDYIINMDEIPLYFDVVHQQTSVHMETSVLVKTSAYDKRHLTLVLAVTASGKVLPSMIILKGDSIPTYFKVPKGWIVAVQEHASLNANLMSRWIYQIYKTYTKGKQSLCILDSFPSHVTDSVKENFRQCNAVMAAIPEGCTCRVQPLDVAIKKQVKRKLCGLWSSFFQTMTKCITDDWKRNIHWQTRYARRMIIDWVVAATSELSSSMIFNTFKVCGISNQQDGSEEILEANTDFLSPDIFLDDVETITIKGFFPVDIVKSLQKNM